MERRMLSSERPRDRLGRPLAWGAKNEVVLDDYDNLSIEQNHELACSSFDSGEYFPAHEAWETAWKQSKGTPDEELFKGLSQMGAGYTHLLRGNRHGAITLLERAAGRIAAGQGDRWGLDTAAVSAQCERDARGVEMGALALGMPPDDPPRVS